MDVSRFSLSFLLLFLSRYMKYLYQYECEKEHLSSQDELQQAIDGNRREGRRSSYGHYSEMVGATPPPPGLTPRSNSNNNHISSSHHTSPLSLVSRQVVNGNNSQGASSGQCDSLTATGPHYLTSLPASSPPSLSSFFFVLSLSLPLSISSFLILSFYFFIIYNFCSSSNFH